MAIVSVIITTFNRPDLLRETIQSILVQTFSDLELIVVDNFSSYDFSGLIKEYDDPRIRAYQNMNGGIIAVNRNFGIRVAKTGLIAFCDDDDVWVPDKLKKQLAVLTSKPQTALVCTGCSFIGAAPSSLVSKAISNYLSKTIGLNIIPSKYLLTGISYITNSSMLFHKKILDDVGMLNEDPELRTVEDFDLWLRISMKYPIYYMHDKLVKYRVHPNQFSNPEAAKKKTKMVLDNYNSSFNFIQKAIVLFLR
jgi:glycosyltransferase involved in cell wall biosynthesis